MIKKILMVVDCQYDFYNPEGSLYVGNGADELPSKIANIIDKFDGVVFTLDWHPSNHCSFKENGGQWPKHCVKYTKGASLPDILMEKVKVKKKTSYIKVAVRTKKNMVLLILYTTIIQ